MRYKINQLINSRLLTVLIINGILGILMLLAAAEYSNANNIANLLLGLSVLAVNVSFYVKSKLDQKAELLILVTWELTIIIEAIYRIVRFDSTPYRILYIPDILCLLFYLEMLYRGRLRKNRITNIIVLILITTGTLSSIFNKREITDCIHGLMLIFRIWGLYLYTSTSEIEIPKWTGCVLGISMGAFVMETLCGFNVDFRNGIFGYEYVGGLFQLVLVVWLSKAIVNDFNVKGNHFLWIKIAIVELIFALREAKAECVLLIVWVFVIIFLLRKKKNAKLIIYPAAVASIGIIGWNLIPVFSPKWKNVFKKWGFFKTVGTGIVRLFVDDMSMPLGTFLHNEGFTVLNWLFGIGFGAAQPPAYYRFLFLDVSGLSGFPKSIWLSSLITKYYDRWAESLVFYHGMYDVIIDIGIVGLLCFIAVLAIFLYKSYKLCHSRNLKSNVLGAAGIWQIIYVVVRMAGYNILVVPLSMMVFGLLLGMIEYRYQSEYKSR